MSALLVWGTLWVLLRASVLSCVVGGFFICLFGVFVVSFTIFASRGGFLLVLKFFLMSDIFFESSVWCL